jgi:hypothetical protein
LINRIHAYAESIGADKMQDPLKSYGAESVKKIEGGGEEVRPIWYLPEPCTWWVQDY